MTYKTEKMDGMHPDLSTNLNGWQSILVDNEFVDIRIRNVSDKPADGSEVEVRIKFLEKEKPSLKQKDKDDIELDPGLITIRQFRSDKFLVMADLDDEGFKTEIAWLGTQNLNEDGTVK